ncbi:MAG: heme ABC transporter ATP-binding protein [Candidatus Binatus sp.]|uniref:heme ABC transporter ATP-binding protein n=1 Tax=Candidatus Binatus sp. TaxID=2811406 RepID=UPI002721529D|nr:heme ABC transporter ATP-binding protein [Candidatus Binatus sp.]MDO8433418.1 heme ABC transporter ATP-binding protein [Candidatus Binatus sp.]
MSAHSDASAIALQASAIHAGYPAVPVLHGVSLQVAMGEMLAIVGPNGAGKSTLLKVLNGSMLPASGSVELFGRPIASMNRRELARTIASVGQENAVAFRFTVLEIVLMGRAPHLGAFHFESPRDLEIATAALDSFGLAHLAGRHIQELSGGERKRAFLARALAQQPRVALLDEPTAFLDLKHVAEILTRFRELCGEGRMAVVATMHDLNAAALYADRVLLLKDGATVAYGTPAEVLTADHLRRVYETEVYVGRNPSTGALMILPAAMAATARNLSE